ncbi:hypothetical protein B0H13DRAFT_1915343 [Mycena leptocephala]|nr:hypothetical protein B0H13DRAFT_1915343 [Mycena leptocephala]
MDTGAAGCARKFDRGITRISSATMLASHTRANPRVYPCPTLRAPAAPAVPAKVTVQMQTRPRVLNATLTYPSLESTVLTPYLKFPGLSDVFTPGDVKAWLDGANRKVAGCGWRRIFHVPQSMRVDYYMEFQSAEAALKIRGLIDIREGEIREGIFVGETEIREIAKRTWAVLEQVENAAENAPAPAPYAEGRYLSFYESAAPFSAPFPASIPQYPATSMLPFSSAVESMAVPEPLPGLRDRTSPPEAAPDRPLEGSIFGQGRRCLDVPANAELAPVPVPRDAGAARHLNTGLSNGLTGTLPQGSAGKGRGAHLPPLRALAPSLVLAPPLTGKRALVDGHGHEERSAKLGPEGELEEEAEAPSLLGRVGLDLHTRLGDTVVPPARTHRRLRKCPGAAKRDKVFGHGGAL